MNGWLKIGMIALGAALAGSLTVGTTARAQEWTGRGPGNGAGGGPGGPDASLVAVAADTLGITRAELVDELNAGKTIAEVAVGMGVDPAAIVDAYLSVRAADLQQAVADGRITQDQADAMLANMRTHVTGQINAVFQPDDSGDGDGVCDGTGPHGRTR